MLIVFCCDPTNLRKVEPAYLPEAEALKELGGERALISYEALVNDGDPAACVRGVAARPAATPALYRGWMLSVERYAELYQALADKGVLLINDPAAYRVCHHLPDSYPFIAARTPRTIWLPGRPTPDEIMRALAPFGSAPLIVKDYVKSRKHEWDEACFIPHADDSAAALRVTGRFLELQGDDLTGGLVFREFAPLAPLGVHPQSGMPLTEEFRIFYLDGRPVFSAGYWREVDYQGAAAPVAEFAAIARAVPSRFFTMDVARRQDGTWIIIELGDGQVAGLPDDGDAPAFYRGLMGL